MPRISQLPALTVPEANDELAIVDASAATTKKITRNDFLKGAALPADTVTTDAITDGAVTASKTDFMTFSTTEKVVGTWIDGRTLYRKTVNFGALPNSDTKRVAHGITGLQDIIKVEGYTNAGVAGTMRPIPYVSTTLNNQIQLYVTSDGLVDITTASNLSVYANTFITLTYTKSV